MYYVIVNHKSDGFTEVKEFAFISQVNSYIESLLSITNGMDNYRLSDFTVIMGEKKTLEIVRTFTIV